jgi:hypothetical protein
MAGRGSVVLAAVALLLALSAGSAAAQDFVEDHERLVKVTAPDRAAMGTLHLDYDVGYVIGDRTAVVVATDADIASLRADGFEIGKTITDEAAIEARRDATEADVRAEKLAGEFAENGIPARGVKRFGQTIVNTPGEVVIMRAYTFTNYAGKFLYVEAHSKLGTTSSSTTANLSVATAGSDGVFGTAVPFTMPLPGNDSPRYTDAGQYMYHRHLQPVSGPDPVKIRVASDKGGVDEAPVTVWLGKSLPPHVPGYQSGFFSRYMDPTEVYDRFDQLAAQFPDIAEIVPLPEKTSGYQRKAMTVVGPTNFTYTGQTGTFNTAARAQAVALESNAMGHQGGNLLTAQLVNPGVASSPLSVSMNGMDLTVSLATSDTGAVSSTAAQIVAAINADPNASALLRAHTVRGDAGAGISQPGARVQLSDWLNAPSHVQRGPFQMRMLRIGKQRDGSKVGVFIYCQQHAREWVTPITCLETGERLIRNYATDPGTKELVDNLDIFIVPSINPDGGHNTLYDFQTKRRNMVNYCPTSGTGDRSAATDRNTVGVDLNRNNTIGTIFDGYDGADSSCTSDVFSGPFEKSEIEIRNEHWVVDTFTNIKFSMNIHTHGGYFMWAPGAYKVPGRITLPAPNIGVEKYFFDVADRVLSRIEESRDTVILPNRTGPIADVLYSAAGNSADDQYYRRGIIAYSFEAGAQRVSFNAQNQMVVQDVGFFPNFETEGKFEALEFSDGNYGLLEGALEYARDTTAPVVDIEYSASKATSPPINWRFSWPGEAAVIHYTTDGSTPTLASPTYENQGPRRPGQVFTIDRPGTHVVKWLAVDIKGNVSAVQSQTFLIGPDVDVSGTVPGTLALTLGSPVSLGAFTPGVAKDYQGTLTANVISTAGDAALSVTDASTNATGRLVNGAFALPQALQLRASSAAGGPGSAFAPLSSTAGSPLSLLSYAGPTSNDAVTIGVKQSIGATDALRTGTYSKTLTFTLSTTSP